MRLVAATLVLAAALTASGAPVDVPPYEAWVVEMVDTSVSQAIPGVATDSQGRLHLAYRDGGDGRIAHLVESPTGWISEKFTELGSAGTVALAIDAEDRIHLTYRSIGSQTKLVYSRQVGSSWETVTLSTAPIAGLTSRIRVDGEGNPHVTYKAADWRIDYAFKDAGGWHFETVTTQALDAFHSLALDSQGAPHVVYPDLNANKIRHSWRSGGAWSTELAADAVGGWTGLAIDSQDRLHVAFAAHIGGEVLGYAMRSANGWSLTVADNRAPTGGYPSIAVDAQDRPHIAYRDIAGTASFPANSHMSRATQTSSGAWTTEYVDLNGQHELSAIAFGVDGRLHITYEQLNDQVPFAPPPVNRWGFKVASPIDDHVVRVLGGALP